MANIIKFLDGNNQQVFPVTLTSAIYDEDLNSFDTIVSGLKNMVGSPLVAATAAAMTDTDHIYVYTGSEAGYTSGHWYYYDGDSWEDGGVYNSTAFTTDTTLAVAGMAADAKATGDELDELKSESADNAKGIQTIRCIANWVNGGLSFGDQQHTTLSINTNQKYRIASTDLISFDYDVEFVIASGYRLVYLTKSNGVFTDNGYKTGKLYIPAGTEFCLVVAKVTENTSSVADINEFASAVTFITKTENTIRNILSKEYLLTFEHGTITSGSYSSSTTYVRTPSLIHANKNDYITVTPSGKNLRFQVVYKYSNPTSSSYVSAEDIANANSGGMQRFVFTEDCWFAIRASTENTPTLTDEDVASFCTWYTFHTKATSSYGNFYAGFNDFHTMDMELGSIVAGAPSTSTLYIRNKDFVKAYKGDVLRVIPSEFNVTTVVYFYTAPKTTAYTSAYTITASIAKPNVISYTFTSDCYFKIRSARSNFATLSGHDIDVLTENNIFLHYYRADDFQPYEYEQEELSLDYTTLKTSMIGKVNFAIQTDTHMSEFDCYKTDGTKFSKSDFNAFRAVLKSINHLGFDAVMNLGDIIRGYEFDPDYETRKSLDDIINDYDSYISAQKLYVVGNHDDGNMYYHNTTYNDKQNVSAVLYPHEQFNRISKRGAINKGCQNYYYKDLSGIRVICLYQKDFDYSSSVPANEAFKIGSDQLTWLSNTALDTELPVLIITHAPLISSLYATGGIGFSDAMTAISSFVSGGGTVIAILAGHTHAQNSATVDGINHIVFKNGYTWFEMMSIDLTNETITCKSVNNTLVDITMSF